MNRRMFLAGLVAGAAGLMVPERKVWALDRTMIPQRSLPDELRRIPESFMPHNWLTEAQLLEAVAETYHKVDWPPYASESLVVINPDYFKVGDRIQVGGEAADVLERYPLGIRIGHLE